MKGVAEEIRQDRTILGSGCRLSKRTGQWKKGGKIHISEDHR